MQRTCDLKDYGHSIFFNGNLTYASWSYNMLIDHIISRMSKRRIREAILIGDNATLLDYGHLFMRSMHTVDSHEPELRLVVIYIG